MNWSFLLISGSIKLLKVYVPRGVNIIIAEFSEDKRKKGLKHTYIVHKQSSSIQYYVLISFYMHKQSLHVGRYQDFSSPLGLASM